MSAVDKRLIGAIFGMVFLVCTACASQPGSIPNTGGGQTPLAERNLANTKWKLVSFSEPGLETPVIVGSTITLEFDSEGQAGGSGSCNAYSIQYEMKDNMLSLGELIHTMTACEQEGIGQQEQRYFQAIENAGRFELAGNRLMIWYADGQGVLNFVKM
jgi:heat shock protein HslJ